MSITIEPVDLRTSVSPCESGRAPRMIDLFCGAGGMSLGFAQMGFQPVWANDFNRFAADTYNLNFGPHCLHGDLVSILESEAELIPRADIVVGGPPCQGFSLLNRNRGTDPRKQLWRPYMEVVRRSGARVFVMENVPQLLGTPEFWEILNEARALGFRVAYAKLPAANYGVPQTRTRAFIVGNLDCEPGNFFPPRPSHLDPAALRKGEGDLFGIGCSKPSSWRTVRDAIGDLPAPVGISPRDVAPPLDLHFGRSPTPTSMARYRAVPEQGMNRMDLLRNAPDLTPECWVRKKSGGTDLFGRLWWDRPAFTIRTEFFKPEKGRYLHPEQHRPITHREAARFQSFPDSFRFSGTKIEIAKQIGNAVPPRLAEAVASSVMAMMRAVVEAA